ncbi:RNA lariat debranching enzyme [Cryptococcus neoformans]|nr:RNA lariat debranching enzyme [Cryptococcus neoformans var. grubii]
MRIAIQGCSHGSLAQIYDVVNYYSSQTKNPIDLLLLCGDFQALRSKHDYASLAVPAKFKQLGSFHQYYSGERVAPVLTIVIGGNHEASNYMWELYHGGWLAPSIYYLGAAGSVYVNGVRIVGASGIYKGFDYRKGHFEKVPYNDKELRSIYHIREYDVEKLMHLTPSPSTIFLSHDWPTTIAHHGNKNALLKRKPFFRDEIEKNTLGSPPLLRLMNHFQPSYWFSAHLHVKFAALYEHQAPNHGPDVDGGAPLPLPATSAAIAQAGGNPDEIQIDEEMDRGNPDEIIVEDEDEEIIIRPRQVNPDEIVMDDEEFDDPAPAVPQPLPATTNSAFNPEEIIISDQEFDAPTTVSQPLQPFPPAKTNASNPEEIAISDDEFDDPAPLAQSLTTIDESTDLIAQSRSNPSHPPVAGTIAPPTSDSTASRVMQEARQEQQKWELHGGKGMEGVTKFLALDKCGPGKDHMQFLEIPDPSPSPIPGPPRLTYDPEWLAISRAFHPYLSTSYQPIPLPSSDVLEQMVKDEVARIKEEGLLVPTVPQDGAVEGQEGLVWEKGKVDVGRVQRFWWTAPPEGHPGGNDTAWYTNPQTEAFCGMLGVQNKINPPVNR